MTLREELIQNNFVLIKDFITEEDADYLYQQLRDDIKTFPERFDNPEDSKSLGSIGQYNWHWILELLVMKTADISNILREPMLPTFSYTRYHTQGSVLKKHLDRPACEVSVSLHLGSDGTAWPIHYLKPDGTTESIVLKPGQAVLYLGCESLHWRDEFQGQHYGQAFIHWVRSRSKNWVEYFDSKDLYETLKTSKEK